jgi:hypothetical protein
LPIELSPIADSRELPDIGGSALGSTRGATDSSIETGCGFLACVAMGLR